MRVQHFYPRTNNIGDHFVQRGIEQMIRRLRPTATFELFDVNSRGESKFEYGLTHRAVERANREADLIIIGGSNLYEGNYRWRWGVHLDPGALAKLRVPLLLLGIGSGSSFDSPPHRPSKRALREIRLINEHAKLSGARDVITLEWLHQLGIGKVQLTGDPAAFIFNEPFRQSPTGPVVITLPPRRFWSSKLQFFKVRAAGRPMFRALVSLAETLKENGDQVVFACNDPADLPLTKMLLDKVLLETACPETPEKYFQLLQNARAVVSGRLHTAVAAFSLGLPFIILNVDQRTNGFIRTHGLENCSLTPSPHSFDRNLHALTSKLLRGNLAAPCKSALEKRDQIYARSMTLLEDAIR
jgi:polysaccharide pyruvyl transferase WcaK-like protein